MSAETVTTLPVDQWGRGLPILARSIAFLDGAGLASPAQSAADGTLTLTVPTGATRARIMCAAKGLRVGLDGCDLTEATAGSYAEFAAAAWIEVYCLTLTTIMLRTSDGSQQNIQFLFDTFS